MLYGLAELLGQVGLNQLFFQRQRVPRRRLDGLLKRRHVQRLGRRESVVLHQDDLAGMPLDARQQRQGFDALDQVRQPLLVSREAGTIGVQKSSRHCVSWCSKRPRSRHQPARAEPLRQ